MTTHEFRDFLKQHMAACGMVRWPDDPRAFEPWRHRFEAMHVDHGLAVEASARVAMNAPRFPNEHLNAICDAVTAIRQARRDQVADRAGSGQKLSQGEHEELRRASRGCLSCDGNGLAIRHGKHDRSRTVTVYCLCPIGRWTKARHEQDAPDVARKIVDLADHRHLEHPVHGGPSEREVAAERGRQSVWDGMDEDNREHYRRRARAEVEAVRRWPKFVEAAARDLAYRELADPVEVVAAGSSF